MLHHFVSLDALPEGGQIWACPTVLFHLCCHDQETVLRRGHRSCTANQKTCNRVQQPIRNNLGLTDFFSHFYIYIKYRSTDPIHVFILHTQCRTLQSRTKGLNGIDEAPPCRDTMISALVPGSQLLLLGFTLYLFGAVVRT